MGSNAWQRSDLFALICNWCASANFRFSRPAVFSSADAGRIRKLAERNVFGKVIIEPHR